MVVLVVDVDIILDEEDDDDDDDDDDDVLTVSRLRMSNISSVENNVILEDVLGDV